MAVTVSHSHFVHAAFVSSLVCQTFDRMILGRMSFPGAKCFHGGTRWKYRAHKWYAIRKSLGTAELYEQFRLINCQQDCFCRRWATLNYFQIYRPMVCWGWSCEALLRLRCFWSENDLRKKTRLQLRKKLSVRAWGWSWPKRFWCLNIFFPRVVRHVRQRFQFKLTRW